MADVLRNSFQEAKAYVQVTFQRRKDVLDWELNEEQQIRRAFLYYLGNSLVGSTNAISQDTGGLVTTDGVTANTITINSGHIVLGGIAVYIPANIVYNALVTPVGNQTVNVWLGLRETEVDSNADPNILENALGETAVRLQMLATVYVDQGGVTPPTTTGLPYDGFVTYIQVATIARTTAPVISTTMITDLRRKVQTKPNSGQWSWQIAVPETATSGPLHASGGTTDATSGGYSVAASGSGTVMCRINPKVGESIVGIGIVGNPTNINTSSLSLYYVPVAGGAPVLVASQANSWTGAQGQTKYTSLAGLPHAVIDGAGYFISAFQSATGVGAVEVNQVGYATV